MQLRPLSPARSLRAARRVLATLAGRAAAFLNGPGTPAERNAAATPAGPQAGTYASLYEEHAVALPPDASIGDGDFDVIGRAELAILTDAGLLPTWSLLDFGCGTGRLAVHAVPFLDGGHYLGTDIAPTMLEHAANLLQRRIGSVPGHASFAVQPDESFPIDHAPDMICAFSVFTHMEHEDTFRYLCAARTVAQAHTVFVASCLQIEIAHAQLIFRMSAGKTLDERWREVRNVVTSRELFTGVAALAGWTVVQWWRGDEPAGTLPDGSKTGVGQSIAIMTPTP